MILRRLEKSDVGDEYVKWMNDCEVLRYLECGAYTKDELIEYVDSKDNLFGIFVYGEHVGNIKISREGNIGLLIGRDHWGLGYGTEAVKQMVDYGFIVLGFSEVTAGFLADNVGSRRIFEKNDFKINGCKCSKNRLHGATSSGWVVSKDAAHPI